MEPVFLQSAVYIVLGAIVAAGWRWNPGIRRQIGDCVMPREGVFAVVLEEGTVQKGDEIHVC